MNIGDGGGNMHVWMDGQDREDLGQDLARQMMLLSQ